MRNGLLLAALAALLALAAPAANADPLLTISAPPSTGGGLFTVPYTLDPPLDGALVVLDMRPHGTAEFHRYATVPAKASGVIGALIYPSPVFDVVEGDWDVRVGLTWGADDQPAVTAEGTTHLDYEASFWVSSPYFGDVPVGITTSALHLRIKNMVGGPLRIRSVKTELGSEVAVTDDGCGGLTLNGLQGCDVGVTFTAAAAGLRKAAVLVDSNAPTKEVYMMANGIAPDPAPQPSASPTSTPTPTPVADVPTPQLSFGSVPGSRSTWLIGLKLEDAPAGSTVTVRCAKGCPTKSLTRHNAKGTISLKRFTTRALKVGTTIRVTLAPPNQAPRTGTITIRARRPPKVTGDL